MMKELEPFKLYHQDEVDAKVEGAMWKGIGIGLGSAITGFLLLLGFIAVYLPA